MDKNKIILKDPADLVIHPLAKLAPEWPKDDERFIALVEDIRDRGMDYPLLIDSEGRIVDGRPRWRAAKQLQWTEVECRVISDQDVAGTILNSLLQRRHFTKGALAYLSFPLMETSYTELRQRHLARLRTGQRGPSSTQQTMVKTVEEFAEGLGFSRPLFYQAREIHGAFAKTPGLKAHFEPRILSGEIGLGACIAGMAGKMATDGKARRSAEQLELFQDAFDVLQTRFSYWQKFDTAQKATLVPLLRQTVAQMPNDLRDELSKALKAANKDGLNQS